MQVEKGIRFVIWRDRGKTGPNIIKRLSIECKHVLSMVKCSIADKTNMSENFHPLPDNIELYCRMARWCCLSLNMDKLITIMANIITYTFKVT